MGANKIAIIQNLSSQQKNVHQTPWFETIVIVNGLNGKHLSNKSKWTQK